MDIPRGASALLGVELTLGVAVAVVSPAAMRGRVGTDGETRALAHTEGLLATSTSRR